MRARAGCFPFSPFSRFPAGLRAAGLGKAAGCPHFHRSGCELLYRGDRKAVPLPFSFLRGNPNAKEPPAVDAAGCTGRAQAAPCGGVPWCAAATMLLGIPAWR